MLRSKSFVKRTRKGNVIKVVKEHYLRDDIPCSSQLCTTCTHHQAPVLSDTPRSTSALPCHYLIPDTNVFMNQLDLMEHSTIKNVIVLQTVRDELKHLSLPVYNQLNAMLANANKRFTCLPMNIIGKETFIEKLKDESPNDRNDRAIRVSVKWYADHLKGQPLRIVLLSDNRANREKATAIGLKAVSLKEYVGGIKDVPELLDIVVAPKDNSTDKNATIYEEHLTSAQIQNGIKKGTLIQSSLNISQHNVMEGTASGPVDGETRTIYIQGRPHLNRSIQGDIVALQLLPKLEWKRTASMAMEEDSEDEEGALHQGDKSHEKLKMTTTWK
ncbi:unnamed protein product [Absidia cylindrospora]